MKNLYTLFLLLASLTKLHAATITSNGTGGGTWSSTSTWSGGTVPGTSDDVVIAASDAVNVNTAATILSLDIGSASTVNLQANLSITSTADAALKFSGVNDNPALLIAQGTTACTLFDAGGVSMSTTSGNRGYIIMKNATHILEVQGNLSVVGYISTAPGIDLQNSSMLKLTGTATAGITIGTTVGVSASNIEVGDGVNTKTVNLPATGAALKLYNNGGITVKNAATLNCNGFTGLNGGTPGTGVYMDILNGGSVYNASATAGTTNNVFLNIPKLSSLADFKLVTGSLYIYATSVVPSSTSFNIPTGSVGNLIFGSIGGTYSYSYIKIYTNGTGQRTVRILGDFTSSSLPGGTTTGGYLKNYGSATASDAPNVTWEFAGSAKQINYDKSAQLYLSDYNNPTLTPKVFVSGSYTINPEYSGTGTSSQLNFGDLTIASGASLTAKTGLSGATGSYIIYCQGNLQIGTGGIFDVSASPYYYHQGYSTAPCTLSGAGTLKTGYLVQDGATNSTLANIIYKAPITASTWTIFSNTSVFNQTAGTLTLDAPGGRSILINTSAVHTINHLSTTPSTIIVTNYQSNLKVNGNINLGIGTKFQTLASAPSSNTGYIEFAGTTPQTVTCDAIPGAVNFQKLKINNPSGITISSGTVTVGKDQGSITTQNLDLTAGNINTTSASQLVILPTTTITNAGNASYVAGPMRMYASWKPNISGATAQTTTTLQFLTGKSSRLQQAALTGITGASTNPALGNGDYVDAEYFSTSYGSNTTVSSSNSPAMVSTSYKEYWNLSPSTTAISGKVKLFWADNANSAIFNKGSDYLRIAHWTGSTWHDEGNDLGVASAAPGTIGSIQSTNTLTSFSPFTFGTTSAASVPLPNSAISLSAIGNGQKNELAWTVADEAGIVTFSVERSADGLQFAPLSRQTAQRLPAYNYTDATPAENHNYYRIRAFSKDGSSGISRTVHIDGGNVLAPISAFPNPVTDELNVNLSENVSGNVQLTDAAGSILIEAPLNAGKARLNTSQLMPGLYFVTYSNGEEKVRLRVVKQ